MQSYKGEEKVVIRRIAQYIKHVVLFNVQGFLKSVISVQFDDNLKRLSLLRNTQNGKRCFIVATGPSLTVGDVEMLKNEDTIGVNSISLLYSQTSWRPTYYVCTDSVYFEKIYRSYQMNMEMISEKDVFLNECNSKLVPKSNKIHYLSFSNWNRVSDFADVKYTENLVHGIYAFGTVTNIAIIIAIYMGYKDIYILGADCSNFNQHFKNDVSDCEKDQVYLDNVTKVQLLGYKAIKKETEKKAIHIYNVTRGGALEVFPRRKLEDVINE